MQVPSITCYGNLSSGSHDDKRERKRRWTDVTKLIVTYRDYANAHKKYKRVLVQQLFEGIIVAKM